MIYDITHQVVRLLNLTHTTISKLFLTSLVVNVSNLNHHYLSFWFPSICALSSVCLSLFFPSIFKISFFSSFEQVLIFFSLIFLSPPAILSVHILSIYFLLLFHWHFFCFVYQFFSFLFFSVQFSSMERYATDLTLTFGFCYHFPLWLFFKF